MADAAKKEEAYTTPPEVVAFRADPKNAKTVKLFDDLFTDALEKFTAARRETKKSKATVSDIFGFFGGDGD